MTKGSYRYLRALIDVCVPENPGVDPPQAVADSRKRVAERVAIHARRRRRLVSRRDWPVDGWLMVGDSPERRRADRLYACSIE